MIELLDIHGVKFYLNVLLIEQIQDRVTRTEIFLTNGRSVLCMDNAKQLATRITMMQMSMNGSMRSHGNSIP